MERKKANVATPHEVPQVLGGELTRTSIDTGGWSSHGLAAIRVLPMRGRKHATSRTQMTENIRFFYRAAQTWESDRVRVADRRNLLPRHGQAGGRRAHCYHLIAIYTRAPRSSNCTAVRQRPRGQAPSGHVSAAKPRAPFKLVEAYAAVASAWPRTAAHQGQGPVGARWYANEPSQAHP